MKKLLISKWYIFYYLICFTLPFVIVKQIFSSSQNNDISVKDSAFLCNFNSSTPKISSSLRDVVFFYATTVGPGLELAVRSLRSTGSNCRIILFYPETKNINKLSLRMFRILKVEVVRVKDKKGRQDVPHMIRYEYEHEWLLRHLPEVDRIFHTDSFDVFFQGDPFSSQISKDELTFVVEPHCIRSCGWNTAWLAKCYVEPTLHNMRHHYIICSGSIAGGVKMYIKLLELMINSPEWTRCWDRSLDQPILNVLVWMGNVSAAGIKYTYTGCDGGFFTVQWCALEKEILHNEHGQVISLKGVVPSYIHQYNRIDNFTKELYKKCRIKPR